MQEILLLFIKFALLKKVFVIPVLVGKSSKQFELLRSQFKISDFNEKHDGKFYIMGNILSHYL
jgi:hypothetical protein